MPTLISNGTVVNGDMSTHGDVLIDGETISAGGLSLVSNRLLEPGRGGVLARVVQSRRRTTQLGTLCAGR